MLMTEMTLRVLELFPHRSVEQLLYRLHYEDAKGGKSPSGQANNGKLGG